MSRSERYIPPSDQELERLQKSREAAREFDRQREELQRTALKKCKKAELVELALGVARQSKASEWKLEQEVGLEKPVSLLVHDIEIAIDIATQVDEKRLNYNFEFDQHAYEAIRHGLSQLIQRGEVEEAQAMALKLMEKGSFQIECSDEGLMQEEIEHCLQLVISAVADSSGDSQWAWEMLQRDRMGLLCERPLKELVGLMDGGS